MTEPWGRVAGDGTVYVRTAAGERAVGTWLAGPPAEGLAYYARRYAEIATEVELLERRPEPDATVARRLRDALGTANAVGDLDALVHRLEAVIARADEHRAAQAAVRAAAAEQAVAAKQALAEEAERLAASSNWKQAGDRLRAIGDEWRGIHGGGRSTDKQLWDRVAAARAEFGRRRTAHFAELDSKRAAAAVRKEALVKEAEALSGSREWADTAARYKALMGEWKAAGPAPKGAEDALWARFRAAQEVFFARRAEVNSVRDSEFKANQQVKERILAAAEALDPRAEGAQQKLRDLQERWDAAGKVPREVMHTLEQRMAAVERRVREVTEARWQQADSPLLSKLRTSIAHLEQKLAAARAAGRAAEAEAAEATLATQREWLASAERTR